MNHRKCLSTYSKGTRNQKKYRVVFEKCPKYMVFFDLTNPFIRPSINPSIRQYKLARRLVPWRLEYRGLHTVAAYRDD